jgi:23S rRNA (guanosine2251-2'-O)-methyltransferase
MGRLIYGAHPVKEALRTGRVEALFVLDEASATEESRGADLRRGHEGPAGRGSDDRARRPAGGGGPRREIEEAAKAVRVSPVLRSRDELDALAEGGNHQGVVAVVGEYRYATLDGLLARALGGESDGARRPLILVLDGVQDPQNLGAIVRTAHVAGAHGVVIPKDRAVGVTSAAVKASAGATEHLAIAQVVNVARALEELKAAGLWTVGAVAGGGQPPWRVDLREATALVLGAEGKGIRPLVRRHCDLLVEIPMAGQVASLNVAAAGAMLLYEAVRQRQV